MTQIGHGFRGGFPEALLANTDAAGQFILDAYIRSYIQSDFNQLFGVEFSEGLVGRLWRMIAHNQGGLWNGEMYARSLGVTRPTVNRYVDYLEAAFLVRQFRP